MCCTAWHRAPGSHEPTKYVLRVGVHNGRRFVGPSLYIDRLETHASTSWVVLEVCP
jgi:hypothetical protein